MITPARSVSNALQHGLADQLRDRHDPVERGGVDVLPLVDFFARHDQRVTLRHRLDGEERDDLVVLVDEPARQFAVDDLGEHGRHAVEHARRELSVGSQCGGRRMAACSATVEHDRPGDSRPAGVDASAPFSLMSPRNTFSTSSSPCTTRKATCPEASDGCTSSSSTRCPIPRESPWQTTPVPTAPWRWRADWPTNCPTSTSSIWTPRVVAARSGRPGCRRPRLSSPTWTSTCPRI